MIPRNLDELTKKINEDYKENCTKEDVEFIVCVMVDSYFERLSFEDVKNILWLYDSVNLDNDCSISNFDCDYCEKRSECGTNTGMEQAKV